MRYVLALLALLLVQAAPRAQDVSVGAIRWDDWLPDSPDVALLDNPQWRSRLPFHAARDAEGRLRINGALENVLAAENAYARAGGLDYFVFGLYPEAASWGRRPARQLALNRALVSFLRLEDRSGMRFTVSLNQSFPQDDFADVAETLAQLVAHPDYLRTPDGRAPVFLFGHEPESWSRSLGSPERFRDAFARLREAVRERSGVPLLAVFLHANPQRGAELARALGMDVLSAYVVPAGSGGRAVPYADCVARMRTHWRALADSGLPFLPNMTTGWDYRPRIEARGQRTDAPNGPNWCEPPQRGELGAALREARQAATSDFRSVLVYGWNEFTEGGWLSPTRAEGVARLAEFRQVLSPRSPARDVVLSWPDLGVTAPDCALRSTARDRGATLRACRRSGAEAWPCPPGMAVRSDTVRAPSGLEALWHDGAWAVRRCVAEAPADRAD
ncbi:hypothetical protein GXW78_11130 [Roseomonas terrae]|jgi:hypothetical protein|uniref:Uncharacterized protein n=1 Tax=Neoroseomonas terrae TaxID=424799 RepID=A0ABS5EHS5_9PROT|nr:hypothetical protein [Neoroseomonas terrae]MBR0650217.1 hypothetical protein [Neoroseomonas terrae]